ncbi:hypothetical protein PC9H_008754 [Pleurotus ostreatus]|uniref:Uncharacterized protein n=1 Tax=Pleurotus ostreatus TaxID=5322 RepID=A0A8H6ZTS8_PLEOS|nr:uncharacterized protein PC9H_008754 [Pleurotus ostreatus]KAF7426386.1 hypothetical protein PC9H_008754 [Pleurotus ostreatus]
MARGLAVDTRGDSSIQWVSGPLVSLELYGIAEEEMTLPSKSSRIDLTASTGAECTSDLPIPELEVCDIEQPERCPLRVRVALDRGVSALQELVDSIPSVLHQFCVVVKLYLYAKTEFHSARANLTCFLRAMESRSTRPPIGHPVTAPSSTQTSNLFKPANFCLSNR